MKAFVTGVEEDKKTVFETMTKLHTKYCFDEVITAGREGLDFFVHQWCSQARLNVKAIPNSGNLSELMHLNWIIQYQLEKSPYEKANMILAFPGWNEGIRRYAQKYEVVIEEIGIAK